MDDGMSCLSDIPMSKLPPKVVFRQRRISVGPQTANAGARESLTHPFRLADRVITGEKSGTVAFVGRTEFAEGSLAIATPFLPSLSSSPPSIR